MSEVKNKKLTQAEKEKKRQRKNKRKKILITTCIVVFCILPLVISLILPFMY